MERLTVFDGEFWVHKNFPPVGEDTVDEFVDCVKELAARLAAYEDTGLEPDEISALESHKLLDEYERGKLFEYQNIGCTVDYLRTLVRADREGRIIILPPPAKEGDEAPDCFKSCTGIWCHGYEGFGDEDHRDHCKKCWYFEYFDRRPRRS